MIINICCGTSKSDSRNLLYNMRVYTTTNFQNYYRAEEINIPRTPAKATGLGRINLIDETDSITYSLTDIPRLAIRELVSVVLMPKKPWDSGVYYKVVYLSEEQELSMSDNVDIANNSAPTYDPNQCWYESTDSEADNLPNNLSNLSINNDRNNMSGNTESNNASGLEGDSADYDRFKDNLNAKSTDNEVSGPSEDNAEMDALADDEIADSSESNMGTDGKRTKTFSQRQGKSKKNKKGKKAGETEEQAKARKKESERQAKLRQERNATRLKNKEKKRVNDELDRQPSVGSTPTSTTPQTPGASPSNLTPMGPPPTPSSQSGHARSTSNIRNSLLAISRDESPATSQGRDRERHRRELAQAVARIEQNNPSSEPVKKDESNRAPDNRTFEIQQLDSSPLGTRFREAAALLTAARREHDGGKLPKDRLRFDSRKTRSQDWIIWTLCDRTMEWLTSFLYGDFSQNFKPVLVSDRGPVYKYGIRATYPDSVNFSDEEVIDQVVEVNKVPGWKRYHGTTIRYKDNALDRAYKQATKDNKVNSFLANTTEDDEFSKLVMIRVDQDGHEYMEANLKSFSLGLGVMDLQVFRIKSNQEKEQEKKAEEANKRQNENREPRIDSTPTKQKRNSEANTVSADEQGEQRDGPNAGAGDGPREQEGEHDHMNNGTDMDEEVVVTFRGPVSAGGPEDHEQESTRE